jgi:hypothetical protein
MRASLMPLARRLAASSLAVAAGCAIGPGQPFAELDATLDARFTPEADRVAADGFVRLAGDVEIALDRFELDTTELVLLDLGGAGGAFDPANPPPGYSLCHNGHCHAADGRLVSYEEIAAELAAGEGAEQVVALPVGRLALLEGTSRALDCAPSCELPRSLIAASRLPVTGVALAGRVRDRRAEPRFPGEQAWSATLTFDPALALAGELDLPADRAHDPDVALTVRLAPGGAVFDAVDFVALVRDDGGVVAPGSAAAGALAEGLEAVALGATVAR